MIKPPTAGHVKDGRGYWNYYGSQYLVTTTGPIRLVTGAMSSVNHPGFLSLSRRERRLNAPFSPFHYSRQVDSYAGNTNLGRLHIASGSVDSYSGYCGDILPGYPYVGDLFSLTDPLDTQTKALSRLQDRVKGANVNLAVAFAERQQTLNMLTNSIIRLRKGYEAVAGAAFKTARQILQPVKRSGRVQYYDRLSNQRVDRFKNTSNNLANYWLEFQYGWRPLLSDIYDSCELIAETYHGVKPMVFSASSTARLKKRVRRVTGFYSNAFNEDLEYTKIQTTRYVLEVVEDIDVVAALSHTGVTNPLLVAWELVPYSFVLDWLVPVGTYLEQLNYAQGLKFRRGTVSTRTEIFGKTILMVATDGVGRGVVIEGSSPIKETNAYRKTRSILTDFPYMKFPTFDGRYSTERALSALALLTQFGRRHGYR